MVGGFYLGEDLGFADDHGVEGGGDAEEVLDHGAVLVVVEVGEEIGWGEMVEVGEEVDEVVDGGVQGGRAGDVEFDAVAGGKEDGFGVGVGGLEGGEGGGELGW